MVDRNDRFIRWVPESEIEKVLELGRVSSVGTGKRRKLIVNADATHFEGRKLPGNTASSTTYIEHLGRGPLVTLKRFNEQDGTFHGWRDDLSFAELRGCQIPQAPTLGEPLPEAA